MTTESLLIVDEDEVLASTLARALTRRGFSVVIAHSETEAAEICAIKQFAKALVDIKVAENSGLQLIPKLLEIQPNLKIVMLNSHSSVPTALQAIEYGATNYLSKPVEVEEIILAFDQRPAKK